MVSVIRKNVRGKKRLVNVIVMQIEILGSGIVLQSLILESGPTRLPYLLFFVRWNIYLRCHLLFSAPVKKTCDRLGMKNLFCHTFFVPGEFSFNIDVGFTLAHQRGEPAARRTFMPGHLESEMANCSQRAYEEWRHFVDEPWWTVWTCKFFAFPGRLSS